MRKLVTWIVVTVGIAALVRKLRRRRAAESADTGAPPGEAGPDAGGAGDPADELRRKLAETREDEPVADATLEERRTEVHDEGRAALDEMQRSTED